MNSSRQLLKARRRACCPWDLSKKCLWTRLPCQPHNTNLKLLRLVVKTGRLPSRWPPIEWLPTTERRRLLRAGRRREPTLLPPAPGLLLRRQPLPAARLLGLVLYPRRDDALQRRRRLLLLLPTLGRP